MQCLDVLCRGDNRGGFVEEAVTTAVTTASFVKFVRLHVCSVEHIATRAAGPPQVQQMSGLWQLRCMRGIG